MAFPKQVRGCELESFNTYTTELQPVGTKMVAEDGRLYRFTGVAVATVVGSLYQAPVWVVAQWGAQACAAAAVGATQITAVAAATASILVNDLMYGYFWVDSAVDKSPAMRVKDNIEITHTQSVGTIDLFNKLRLAIAESSTVSYAPSVWRDAIIDPSPSTGQLAGVCVKIIPAASFGWLQTGGACRVLAGGTPVEGQLVVSDTSGVNGVVLESTAIETDGPVVGLTQFDQADTEFMLAHLTIDKNR